MQPREKVSLTTAVALGATGLLLSGALAGASDWTRWGGPEQNFTVENEGIATAWSEEGPPILWRRALGDHGHSGMLYRDGRLYTHVRQDGENGELQQDLVVCLDAASGETIWQAAYDSPLPEGFNEQFGPGPHATPLLVDDLLFTVSSTHRLKAFDAATGEERWSVGLKEALGSNQMPRGYGASPLAWGELVIVNAGGDGKGVAAFRRADGELVWSAVDANGGYSSPLLATIDGVEQVVVALGAKRAGIAPADGTVLWELDLPQSAVTTMATQLEVGEGVFFSSSAYADGSRVLDVRRENGEWQPSVRWYSRKLRLMHTTAVRFWDTVWASSGDFGPAFLSAIALEDGELVHRQRGFAKANVVRVGDYMLLVDEDGTMALTRPTRTEVPATDGEPARFEYGLETLAESQVIEGVSWTVPTVVGTTLFLRNRHEVMALDLGPGGGS